MKSAKLVGLLAVILVAGAAVWFFGFRKKEKPVSLITETPQYGYISKSVTATGTIQPVDTVTVGSQISGTIKNIYADFNSVVKKGQLIAELDKSLLQAQVDQYKANLAVAQSQLAYQQDYYTREKMMFDSQVIAKQEYETASYQLNSAKATVLSVQAQLEAAEKNLSYCDIYSPINGVVLTRNISVGQTVAASFNTPTLFIIARDITKMQVQAAVDEADIGNVTKGQRVTFTVDAYQDLTFTGTVEEIRLQPTVSANVVTYTTIINAPNESMKLKPGMTANITVFTQEEKNALLISAKAIKFRPDSSLAKQFTIEKINKDTTAKNTMGSSENANPSYTSGSAHPGDTAHTHAQQMASVWLRQGNDLVQRKIKIGINDDTHLQVIDGLTTDDEVVTGVESQPNNTGTTTTSTQKSPFIPQRSTPKKSTAK